ncbi:MAG TPA: amino acid ABC transporter substrate-binding protein [Burkholderiales bacterium]
MTNTLLLLSALGILAMATGVSAEQQGDTLAAIRNTQSIRLGYLDQSVPFSFVDQKGNPPQGYSIELCLRVVAGIEQQLGLQKLKVQWVPLTMANRFDMVADGSVDLECGISTITLSRQQKVAFSLMTWIDGGSFVVKAGRPHGGLGDLAGKKIAVIAGTTTESALRDALKKDFIKADLVLVKEHLEGLGALDQGRADAYAADQTVLIGLGLAVKEQLSLALADRNFSFEPYGLTLRRNDADFKLAVNQELARIYRTGQIGAIYDRWFGKLGKPSSMLAAMFAINGLPE